MPERRELIMVGPDPKGLGGISRVVQLWERAGLYEDFGIRYISTVSDHDAWRFQSLARSTPAFVTRLARCHAVYVHTSSNRSFFRKVPFIALAQAAGKPVFLHIHPTHFVDFLDDLSGIRRRIAFELLRRCRAVVVLSDAMRRLLLERIPSLDCVVLPNPVDVAGMHLDPRPERESHRFLYLGWYIREKGIFELAEAVGELARDYPDLRVELHGTKDRSRFEAFLDQRELRRWVRPGDWLEEEGKLDALYRATALVLPSYSEGLPNVVLEAMATRTPLVSTSVGGLKEVLRDNDNAIVVPPQDVAGLVAGLRRCLQDRRLRRSMADTAYNEVCAAHDLPVVRKRFAELVGGRL